MSPLFQAQEKWDLGKAFLGESLGLTSLWEGVAHTLDACGPLPVDAGALKTLAGAVRLMEEACM